MSSAVDIGLVDNDLPDDPQLITGTDLIVQLIGATIQLHQGEWFLDERIGLPHLEWLTTKGIDAAAVLDRIEVEIRKIPGVVRTQGASASTSGRTLSITLDVVTQDGTVTNVSVLQDELGLANSSPWAMYFRRVVGV